MPLICHNGRFLDAATPVLDAANPAFRWGEGLFETMRMHNGTIPLAARHWARLQDGLERLGLNAAALQQPVLENLLEELARRNDCSAAARLRLEVYRDGSGLGFVAEATALDAADAGLNERGWQVEVFPDARIAADAFSSLKRSCYLPYLLAARRAADTSMDECLLLNAWGRVCDGARSSVFVVRGNDIVTPPLSEGAIDGVLRRHLIDTLAAEGRPVREEALTMEDLLAADELFLTNALKGIRWAARFRSRTYGNTRARPLYERLGEPFAAPAVASE
ncbi:aminotransferase class IV [Flaviaesturariibacter aridisoli]|uniref:branched-chain-amino-acid transaminase n=1 Tax=Flaviaesturariibacter aridisoli TaxID=2545761 RepID=A0A4R4DXG4_9BACT|nr:aminotransferase class IV [Flaviaesturariibacter aridisoli]TCZ67715.1 hypothetical protein E0486_15250 [Flaviaesturariibacter aridisoli]